MRELAKEVLWYGSIDPLPKRTLLHVGDLELSYEAGSLRNIKLGDHEIIRMIYAAVRDQEWVTVGPKIIDERIEQNADGFKISYKSIFRKEKIHFHLEATIIGHQNTIVFEIEGEALSDFETNRTGFCLLHPTKECIGVTPEIKSPDGSIGHFTFPQLISRHSPAKDIAEIKYPIADTGTLEIKFSGEVFEMEDQRNWTDDSFKTYCRSVDKPFPYALKKGDKIQQKITLTVSGDNVQKIKQEREFHLTYNDQEQYVLPKIGVRRNPKSDVLEQNELEVLGKIRFGFYEVIIDFLGSWKEKLELALSESITLQSPLKLVTFFSVDYQEEVAEFAKLFSKSKDQIYAIEIVVGKAPDEAEELLEKVSQMLKVSFPGVKIGAGVQGFFADLNSARPNTKNLDFISYSIIPQVHAFDNQSMIENLAGQSATIETAKSFAQDKDVHISPITLKMQDQEENHGLDNDLKARSMPSSIDPRQMSLFGAGWTLGSIKRLAQAGASDITYFESFGEKGIIMGNSDSQYAEMFHANKGAVFPIYYVIKAVLKDSDATIIHSNSSHPDIFEGIVIMSRGKKSILLANYSSDQINVRVDGIAPDAKVRKLDEKNVLRAMYEHEEYDNSPYCAFQFEEPIITFKIRPFGIVFVNE